jgi:hypothetical protein
MDGDDEDEAADGCEAMREGYHRGVAAPAAGISLALRDATRLARALA